MKLITQRRGRLALSLLATLAIGTSLVSVPAFSADYAAPSAPSKVTVMQTNGGLEVFWTRVSGSPRISHYIVSGGVNSCPVIVDGSATKAVMPALSKTALTVTVQAVNEYGISATKAADAPVTPESVTTLPLKSVQLLQLSDFHGQIEGSSTNFGAALLSSNFAAERANNSATFTVSSGDNIGAAPPISSQFAELPTIKAMNLAKFDVSSFGNHEHDRDLRHLRHMIRYSDFQYVASNYSTLRGLNAGNGDMARAYTVISRGGVKVGFVGVTTKDTKDQVMPGNLDFSMGGKKYSIAITEDVAAINSAIRSARAAGADMVVALVHEGWNSNAGGKAVGPLVTYAKSLNADVVFGAHSHLTYSSVLDGKLTAMVKNAGAEYNRTQVCVNTATNKVLGASNQLVTTANAPTKTPDAAVAAAVDGYKKQLNARLDVKVGKVAAISPIDGTPRVQRSGEHVFGNWSSDLIRKKYGTDFALTNGGGIRSSFPAANYTPADKTLVRSGATGPYDIVLGDVYTIHPFGNVFSTIEVTGAQMWAALENGVSRGEGDGRWPHVSGLKVSVDLTKPSGSRVVSMTDLNGKAIPKDGTKFTLTTVDFIAKGGDGYDMFDVAKLNVRDLDADVIIEALRADAAAGKVTEMKLDGRMTVKK